MAYRLYYKFLGQEPPDSLKPGRVGIDLKIPGDNDVFQSIAKACSYSNQYCVVYKLLLESGARLTEIIEMLRNYDPARDKQYNSFFVYELSYLRGTKKSFYIFHTTRVPEPIKYSNHHVSKTARELGIVRPKYLRKYVSTKMAALGIPADVIDFIQGRTPRSILSRHYLNLYALATKEYPKYVDWLRGEGLE